MTILLNKPADNPLARLVLAHGAGAGKDSEFMQDMAKALAAEGIEVLRFDFPYMQTMAETGKRRPPDRAPVLEEAYRKVIEGIDTDLPLFIGGKSMGGRMATHVMGHTAVSGAVVLGYPFHPPGKPEKLRTEHLEVLNKPLLIVQGERDTFGKQPEVEGYALSDKVKVHFMPDGDHSLKPRKASGFTQAAHIVAAAAQIRLFIQEQL